MAYLEELLTELRDQNLSGNFHINEGKIIWYYSLSYDDISEDEEPGEILYRDSARG